MVQSMVKVEALSTWTEIILVHHTQ